MNESVISTTTEWTSNRTSSSSSSSCPSSSSSPSSWWAVALSEKNPHLCTYNLLAYNRTINCSEVLGIHSLPSTASVSFASILFNLLVVFVLVGELRRRRRRGWRRTQTQSHLLCLAVSDLSVGLGFVWGAILGWTCVDVDEDSTLKVSGSCACSFVLFKNGLFLAVSFNRLTTLYVTLIRAIATTNVKSALSGGSKSPARIFAEVAVFDVSGGSLVYLAGSGLARCLRSPEKDPFLDVFFVVSVAYTLLMAAAAAFILCRLYAQKDSALLHSSGDSGVRLANTAADDFRTLVAVVASVFCLSNIAGIAFWGLTVFASREADVITTIKYWAHISIILNSCLNFFIYMFFSANFRRAFIEIGKCDRTARRGKIRMYILCDARSNDEKRGRLGGTVAPSSSRP